MPRSVKSFKEGAYDPKTERLNELMDIAAEASAEEGIRQGLADLSAGKPRTASEVFADFRARHGLAR